MSFILFTLLPCMRWITFFHHIFPPLFLTHHRTTAADHQLKHFKLEANNKNFFLKIIFLSILAEQQKDHTENWYWEVEPLLFLYLTVWLSTLGICAGWVWKRLEMQDRKTLECCEWSLRDDSGVSSKDQNVDRNVDGKVCAYEVWIEMRTLWGNGARGLSCYILTLSTCKKLPTWWDFLSWV